MGEADSDVEIDLVVRRELVGSAEVQNLAGTTALRKIAGIFYEGIPGFGELTVEVKGGLAGEVVRSSECGPVESDLATERPMRRERERPRQLKGGVVVVARDGSCSGGEAEIEDRGEIEIARKWAELLLDSEGQVAEAGSRAGTNGEIVVVVGNCETKLCFWREGRSERWFREGRARIDPACGLREGHSQTEGHPGERPR